MLLYDGYCALCNSWVAFLLRVDGGGSLRFAPLSGTTGRALIARHPELGGIDSLILVEGPRVTVRSTAVLRIIRYLGGPWRIFLAGYFIPREIRDSLYDIVAYWRNRLFGRYEACPIPPAAAQARFLP
ncbi:MAG: DCC1-like thiol-disulfide oxidoreductase family protein [Gemmatimonadota bacterium]|nr:DCC1-like thiol-disulfide oxidoreductase family protein [Gemmatimonadota bacterium]